MTLYRKYRPKTFAEVVGQTAVKHILKEEVRTGQLAHAYLFSGPRGTGKTSLARLLAKALNCEKLTDVGEACGECASCTATLAGRQNDLIEIDAASNRRIDEIRELREQVRYVPASSKYKIYIIDEVHMLTAEAFNALLKTLEEPPSHVLFILATTELHKIPETIFSRCQHFTFSKLTLPEIVGRLQFLCASEKVEVAAPVLEAVARRSGGALRDAESLLGQIISIGKKNITVEDAQMFLPQVGAKEVFAWLSFLAADKTPAALKKLVDLEDKGVNLEFFLAEALETGRQLLLYAITQDKDRLALYFSSAEIEELIALAAQVSVGKLRKIVIELLRAAQDMKLSPDLPILPIELAVVSICEVANNVSTEKTSSNLSTPTVSLRPADSAGKQSNQGEEEGSTASHAERDDQIAAVESTLPRNDKSLDTPPSPRGESSSQSLPPSRGESEGGSRAPDGAAESSAPASHSLEDILAGWGEVLTKVQDKSQALNFVLGVAEPVAVAGGKVTLGFKYRLQQEKINEAKNREIVETIIHEVFGANYRIVSTFKEDIQLKSNKRLSPHSSSARPGAGGIHAPQAVSTPEDDALVAAALEVFGGGTVESV